MKIVWRVTGTRSPELTARGPDGHDHPLRPEYHYSSNFNRPGDEWGAGYRFDQPG